MLLVGLKGRRTGSDKNDLFMMSNYDERQEASWSDYLYIGKVSKKHKVGIGDKISLVKPVGRNCQETGASS